MRVSTHSFRTLFRLQLDQNRTVVNDNKDNSRTVWISRYRVMLSFDFEATVQLKQWNDLGILVEESRSIADVDDDLHLYAVFADLILCLEAVAPMDKVIRIFEVRIYIYI